MDFDEDGIDEEFLEEMVEELARAKELEPDFRATIRGSRIWIRDWRSEMEIPPPTRPSTHVHPVYHVGLADLNVVRASDGSDNRELLVRWLWRSLAEDDEETLIDWAARTGYRRIWLPDRMVELEIDPERLGPAQGACLTCGALFDQGGPEFWEAVLEQGFFPGNCSICGCAIPEWES